MKSKKRSSRARYLMAIFIITLLVIGTIPNRSSAQADQPTKLKAFQKGAPEELEMAKTLSFNYLEQRIGKYGIKSVNDLKVKRVFVDELSMAHTRVQQTYEGVPVFGGEAIVHLNSDGSLFTFTDSLEKDVTVDTRPDLSQGQAVDMAIAEYGCRDCLTAQPEADIWILRHKGRDHLVYRVQLKRLDGSEETAMPVYFIDAHTGEKVWGYNNLQTDGPTTGTGVSLYSGTVSIGTYYDSGLIFGPYAMQDVNRKIGTYNEDQAGFDFTDNNNTWDSSSQKAAVDVHYGISKALDYFMNVHQRNGIDGNGGPGTATSLDGVTQLFKSRVHYGTNYNGAFWDPDEEQLFFGDGDGNLFAPAVSLDVAGHELMHGITQHTAGLQYWGERGALNESWSDVFGAMVERYVKGENSNTWKIAEACYTPGIAGNGDALRYMDNPHFAYNKDYTSNDDPDHYDERFECSDSFTKCQEDNGGVHHNSGIPNKVFYLVAKGGAHHLGGSMTGIGADAAAKIWYKAITAFMVSDTDFQGARTATLQAAIELYGLGSTEYVAVANAWGLCGVGGLVNNGGFEDSSSPWVLSGYASHENNSSNPNTGSGCLILGYSNYATGYAYQDISIPATADSANLNLNFWLNVSSQETTTLFQTDKLTVEVRNTSGTLLQTLATYSNLNEGTTDIYSKKGAFNLSAYKGQTIRLQFSVQTNYIYTTSFRVDNVSIQ
jgi:Zn-dependent metalloprotease